MRISIIIATLLAFSFCLSAQKRVLFKEPKVLEENRYPDIKGSYYIFEDWTGSTIYDAADSDYQDVLLNYNGHEDNLEAYDGKGNYLNLIPKDYPKVEVKNPGKGFPKDLKFLETLVFVKAPHNGLNSDYYIVLHDDGDKQLLLEYSVSISTVTERPPGEIIEKKRFNKRYVPILVYGDKLHRFSTKKKDVKKSLSAFGDITKWCKSNKLKANSYEGMVAFLEAN